MFDKKNLDLEDRCVGCVCSTLCSVQDGKTREANLLDQITLDNLTIGTLGSSAY